MKKLLSAVALFLTWSPALSTNVHAYGETFGESGGSRQAEQQRQHDQERANDQYRYERQQADTARERQYQQQRDEQQRWQRQEDQRQRQAESPYQIQGNFGRYP